MNDDEDVSSGKIRLPGTDHLGTPLSMHDGQGQTTWSAQLDSYGQLRQLTGKAQACPFRY